MRTVTVQITGETSLLTVWIDGKKCKAKSFSGSQRTAFSAECDDSAPVLVRISNQDAKKSRKCAILFWLSGGTEPYTIYQIKSLSAFDDCYRIDAKGDVTLAFRTAKDGLELLSCSGGYPQLQQTARKKRVTGLWIWTVLPLCIVSSLILLCTLAGAVFALLLGKIFSAIPLFICFAVLSAIFITAWRKGASEP